MPPGIDMSLSKLSFSGIQGNVIGKFLTPAPYIDLDLGMEKLNMVQVDFKSGEPVIIAASSDYHNSSYEELVRQPELFKTLIKSTIIDIRI